jgi:hypothetical protein
MVDSPDTPGGSRGFSARRDSTGSWPNDRSNRDGLHPPGGHLLARALGRASRAATVVDPGFDVFRPARSRMREPHRLPRRDRSMARRALRRQVAGSVPGSPSADVMDFGGDRAAVAPRGSAELRRADLRPVRRERRRRPERRLPVPVAPAVRPGQLGTPPVPAPASQRHVGSRPGLGRDRRLRAAPRDDGLGWLVA